MPARGPHDEFDASKAIIRAAYAQLTLDNDLAEIRRRFVADDAEYVTRDGTLGVDRWEDDWRAQTQRWKIETEVEEIVDAGEGAIIVLLKMRRIDESTGEVAFKAWPANVVRIHDGKLVFFEGYPDPRKAFADLGLEEP